MSYIILTIIPIIISIPAFLVSIKSLKEYNNIKCRCEECRKKENDNSEYTNIDELIYSMDFNTDIDNKIWEMLNKYPDDIIIKEVTNSICEEWLISLNDINKVNNHVKDILLNYNNHYDSSTIDLNEIKSSEFIDEPYSTNDKSSNVIDIRNILNDFYKD